VVMMFLGIRALLWPELAGEEGLECDELGAGWRE